VTASGICHTGLNVINGLSALPLPIVPGHEGCGIVEETGPEVFAARPPRADPPSASRRVCPGQRGLVAAYPVVKL
jgi:threonine dehydrogenase-like Zn-dependent dehydrogenase